MPKLRFHKLNDDAILPEYAHSDDSGFDLYSVEDLIIPCINDSYVTIDYDVQVNDIPYRVIRTGWSIELPQGYELQIRSKSGLAAKAGIFVLNSPATIDEGYRGELQVILANISKEPYVVKKGQKIAQGILSAVTRATIVNMNDTEYNRGAGGFGSTGLEAKVQNKKVKPIPMPMVESPKTVTEKVVQKGMVISDGKEGFVFGDF